MTKWKWVYIRNSKINLQINNTAQSYSTIWFGYFWSFTKQQDIKMKKKSLFITESIKLSKIANNSFSSCHVCIYRIFIILFYIVNMYEPMYRIKFYQQDFTRIFESKILRQTKRNHFVKNGDQNLNLFFIQH